MVIGTPQVLTASSTAIDREFYDYYRTPRGQHPRATTAFSRTSDAHMMLFWSYQHLDWISPRPVLFITGDQAHSRIFSEHAYSRASEPKELVHRSRRRTRRSLRPREASFRGRSFSPSSTSISPERRWNHRTRNGRSFEIRNRGSQMDSSETRRFTGKVAFVTGAASGIGRAAALAFARAGASVVGRGCFGTGQSGDRGMIEQQGGRALAVRCDVTRAEDVKAALEKTVETFGRLDVAFNNAGD